MDRSRLRKLMSDDQDGCEWVNVSFGTGPLGSLGQRAVTHLCVENGFLDFTWYCGDICLQCFDAVGWAAGRASGL